MKNIYECHCHIALDATDFRENLALIESGAGERLIRGNFKKYNEIGAVYLRDGGDKWGISALAAKIAPEYGIEYATPVFPIHKKDNYGSFIGESYDTMTDFYERVKEVKAQGGDFIKVMGAGIMEFGRFGKITGWALPYDEMREIVNISHGEGFAVMVHVNGADGVKNCVEAGVDSIEHGNYMDEEAVKYVAESGCVWVPTVTATTGLRGQGLFPEEMLDKILQMQKDNIALGAKLGALIATGSDAGAKCVPHGGGILSEIEVLKELVSEEILDKAQEKIRQIFKHQV